MTENIRRPGEQSEEPRPEDLDAKQSSAGGLAEPGEPSALGSVYEQGLAIEGRSQWQLARRRFFRHKLAMISLVVLAIIFGAGTFADTVAPYAYETQDFEFAGHPPTFEEKHFFGTDQLGRDYFARVVFGIRTSMRVALLVALLSTSMGTLVGAVAGYFGGWVDNLLMRVTDLVLTLPALAVLLVASALLGQGSPYRVAVILAAIL